MKEAGTILGISLGTRSIGVAVLKDGVLLDWKIQCFKHPWNKRKCMLITGTIAKQLVHYEPQFLGLKIPTQAHPSRNISMLLRAIENACELRGIAVQHCSLANLKSWVGCASKSMLMLGLLNRYPELTECYRKELRQKSGYYSKVFEAVGAATCYASMSQDGEQNPSV